MSDLVVSKQVEIKLYFNRAENMFYVQMGDHSLFKVKAQIAARIQEKERIEIRHAEDTKAMQLLNMEDKANG